MRDHRKLEAFKLADELVLRIYAATRNFPIEERFGLSNQVRRAAVSVGANIVEGSARRSEADYARFLNIAYSSACELKYELSIAERLGYLDPNSPLVILSARTCSALAALIHAFKR